MNTFVETWEVFVCVEKHKTQEKYKKLFTENMVFIVMEWMKICLWSILLHRPQIILCLKMLDRMLDRNAHRECSPQMLHYTISWNVFFCKVMVFSKGVNSERPLPLCLMNTHITYIYIPFKHHTNIRSHIIDITLGFIKKNQCLEGVG